MSTTLPRAAEIIALHDRLLSSRGWPDVEPEPGADAVWRGIQANHRFNSRLWIEEDVAHRATARAEEIAAAKRAIDDFNQGRNDATERMDELLLVALGLVEAGSAHADAPVAIARPVARLNSETAGSIIDRLSVMALKVRAMRARCERGEGDATLVEATRIRLARLEEQRADLGACLDALLADAQAGRATFKVNRQFKMYDDARVGPEPARPGRTRG